MVTMGETAWQHEQGEVVESTLFRDELFEMHGFGLRSCHLECQGRFPAAIRARCPHDQSSRPHATPSSSGAAQAAGRRSTWASITASSPLANRNRGDASPSPSVEWGTRFKVVSKAVTCCGAASTK